MSYDSAHREHIAELSLESKRALIDTLFGSKLREVGPKAPQVKKVQDINKNRKGNTGMHIAVEGVWANSLVLRYRVEVLYLLCALEDIRSPEAFAALESLGRRAEHIFLVSKKTLDSLTESGNASGLLSVCVFPSKTLSDLDLLFADRKDPLIVVLDGLEIPGNVGTIVRSADAADFDAVIVTNKKTRLTHPKFLRSSQGSCFKVPVVEAEMADAAGWLESKGFRVFLADTEGAEPYYRESFAPGEPAAIVMGGERHGIHRAWYSGDRRAVVIPMFGDCDSLNVGIAATVLMYEASLKRKGLR